MLQMKVAAAVTWERLRNRRSKGVEDGAGAGAGDQQVHVLPFSDFAMLWFYLGFE